ncbi:DUF1642 domain-containing protein [Streptococcus hillyeri]|uniref:DUF1642 domain-containing protein n=1 Tax=Streptococcus hillyeri TaxID=2282420 RepID=A0A3L9DRA2_9STRE|nr:DUF1642 domain-containing protein [Streptococcus hillyeri]RLY03094.1 DUF1642 domain-containing protein [Streptococcus hillyeri]
MNKQEAIETIEKMGEYEPFVDEPISKKSVLNIINQIDEPQKVVIPKFVAEWIEGLRDKALNLFDAYQHPFEDKRVRKWFMDFSNFDLFARAWLDGYEIEKDKLYTVEIPNNGGTLALTSINGRLKLDHGYKCFPAKLTEEKIREKFNWAWQWAKPVEEE